MVKKLIVKAINHNYISLTKENIENQSKLFEGSYNYGKENQIIHDMLKTFPFHNDLKSIVMKTAVIDLYINK